MSNSEGIHPHPGADSPRHTHVHRHEHTQTKVIVNRLARAIGHLQHVKNMVERGEDCADVLIQLAAVRSALNNTGKIILQDHIEHCLVDALETGDAKTVAQLNRAIDQFIK